jgi:hypothetical protein
MAHILSNNSFATTSSIFTDFEDNFGYLDNNLCATVGQRELRETTFICGQLFKLQLHLLKSSDSHNFYEHDMHLWTPPEWLSSCVTQPENSSINLPRTKLTPKLRGKSWGRVPKAVITLVLVTDSSLHFQSCSNGENDELERKQIWIYYSFIPC